MPVLGAVTAAGVLLGLVARSAPWAARRNRMLPRVAASVARTRDRPLGAPLRWRGTARCAGDSLCAEEDSNLHPLSVDQALNLVTRVSYPSYAFISSRTSGNLDVMDAMDDLDVAADVATGTRPDDGIARKDSVH